jgi:hypothetical protein
VLSAFQAGVPTIGSWPTPYTDFILDNDRRFQNACHLSQNVAVHDFYPSPNIRRLVKYRRIRWPGLSARMGENRGTYRVLVEKPEGKWTFYVLLTVHLDVILVNDQLDALFLNVFIYASTCFEQQVLIIRRSKLY